MTTHEEALTLALDWFVCYQDKSMSRNNAQALAEEVVEAIKEALAQREQEPCGHESCDCRSYCKKQQPEQEPVAIVIEVNKVGAVALRMSADVTVGTRLYTTPPQRKPLTDEQREEIAKRWRGRNWTVGDIIDAVEAAHGIK